MARNSHYYSRSTTRLLPLDTERTDEHTNETCECSYLSSSAPPPVSPAFLCLPDRSSVLLRCARHIRFTCSFPFCFHLHHQSIPVTRIDADIDCKKEGSGRVQDSISLVAGRLPRLISSAVLPADGLGFNMFCHYLQAL